MNSTSDLVSWEYYIRNYSQRNVVDETGQPLTAFCEIRLEFTLAAVARETAGIFATRPLNINARYVSVCPEPVKS